MKNKTSLQLNWKKLLGFNLVADQQTAIKSETNLGDLGAKITSKVGSIKVGLVKAV